MGIAVNDPEDPAGYDCAYERSKEQKARTCNCACSCDSRNASSSSSSSTANSSSSSTTSNSCCSSNNNSHSNCKHIGNTLTLTFANNNSYGPACSYQHSKTEMLSTPSTSAPITRPTRDLIGNSKEYRIESNKSDLRIIGNGNRIRIGCNQGNLQIIGNNTRLKITNNTGGIRYTGNEGRICLGSDSTQQIIDYIGNNGKLKVVKSSEMLSEQSKSHKQKIPKEFGKTEMTANTEKTYCDASAKVNIIVDSGVSATAAATATANSTAFPSYSTPKKVKVKSASYGGDYSAQWRQFSELFEKHGWRNFASASMPNLKSEKVAKNNIGDGKKAEQSTKHSKSSRINAKSCKIDSSINVVSNYGNICIKNAVNVSM
ncbi:uncharacterized protein DDB_G0271670 [Ceratitis capitata]|uniref:uncharacterized protein DDB_G0271670 n=1 Tax=Ceratitis capitata TaxID=7213 RepID=UPI000329F5ED|nr:uncharacterized protein DDB_G0271670 [Ceratitis capitata]